MNSLDKFLEERDKQELRDFRLAEQERERDYSFEERGAFELCSDCGSRINSHGHCPLCDY